MSELFDEAASYEICVRGHVDSRWSDGFADIEIQRAFGPDGTPITILLIGGYQ
jgi:hypothetical protein